MHAAPFDGTFAGWQSTARDLLVRGIPPSDIAWLTRGQPELDLALDAVPRPAAAPAVPAIPAIRVPRDFLALARLVALHRDEIRWPLLYRALWRLTRGETRLFANTVDPDVIALGEMAKSIRRDLHKMRAFVRFREITTDHGPRFVAWFEPHHHIVEANAPFFVGRFAAMAWSILTPDRCAHWDGRVVTFTPGVTRAEAPPADATEDLWRTYYANIFNPARLKLDAMRKEMPRYYWQNLPETSLLPDLIAAAAPRTAQMVAASARKPRFPEVFGVAPVPATDDLDLVREAAKTCRACPLWRDATCTVFGEGPRQPRIVVVGEQPGDHEDLAGRPFVGPAGKLFDRALTDAGVDRAQLYVTNAVKHFKWKPQGKRRLHQKPSPREIAACRPWLETELRLLRPELIVCLGGTAAQSVLVGEVRVLEDRGRAIETEFGAPALITVHPSSLLRQPDPARREADYAAFVADLRKLKNPGEV